MNFDTFRNIGLKEKGIFKYRIRFQSDQPYHILFCDSKPCVKANIVNNHYIRESEADYKPCYIDYQKNEFISREFSIHYDLEEVSLRDSVCWRVENSKESLGSLRLEFVVDLLYCSSTSVPSSSSLKGDSQFGFLSEEANEPTSDERIVGSQRIVFSNVGAETILQGHNLLFRELGICEIRGVSSCTLIDIRYDHHIESICIPKPFVSYLFDGVTTGEEVRRVYKEFFSLVQKCMELSFNSVVKLLDHIEKFLLFLTVSPTVHYQNLYAERIPSSHISPSVLSESTLHNEPRHHRSHLSDVNLPTKRSSSIISPFPSNMDDFPSERLPHNSISPYPAHVPCVSPATIAFAKSQSLTVAEVNRLHTTTTIQGDSHDLNSIRSVTPLDSIQSALLEETPISSSHYKNDVADHWYASDSESSQLSEPIGYEDYNDFDDESDEEPSSPTILTPNRTSCDQLSALIGSNYTSEESIHTDDVDECLNISDIVQLKYNLATRLCLSMTACSCQIWNVFNQFITELSQHIAVAACDLTHVAGMELKKRFKGLLHVKVMSMDDVEGRKVDREKAHKSDFVAIRNDPSFAPALKELRCLFASRFIDRTDKKNGGIHEDSFTSYLSEWFRRPNEQPSIPSLTIPTTPWRCDNPLCHRLNHPLISTCEYCLCDHISSQDLHLIFILHGYGASPLDMKKVTDFITLTYPHVHCILIHNCFSNSVQSLHYLASAVVDEMLENLRLFEQNQSSRKIKHISFLAHSIGGLVFRLAMNDKRLEPYWPYYHFFLSLNVPHLGVLFASYKTDIGTRLMYMLYKSIQLDELLLREEKDMRQTTLYKMAHHTGLDKFNYVYFFSSYQDTFIPFYSERAEMIPQIEASSREEATIVSEMVTAFWKELKADNCKTVVKKFDVDYDLNRFSIDSIFGHTAHVNILTNVDMIYTLLLKIEECFKP